MTSKSSLTCIQSEPLAVPMATRTATNAAAKTLLRQSLLTQRRMLAQGQRARWDAAIVSHILAWWQEQRWPKIGVYWPLQGEPDLGAAYAALAALGVQLCLPVVQQKGAALLFAQWQPGEAMTRDRMGVAVPAELRFEPSAPALLVPCLGFNAERFRLGYGGGFYDRTLAQLPRPATIGIAYACQARQFASDAHDIALDQVLTEAGFERPKPA